METLPVARKVDVRANCCTESFCRPTSSPPEVPPDHFCPTGSAPGPLPAHRKCPGLLASHEKHPHPTSSQMEAPQPTSGLQKCPLIHFWPSRSAPRPLPALWKCLRQRKWCHLTSGSQEVNSLGRCCTDVLLLHGTCPHCTGHATTAMARSCRSNVDAAVATLKLPPIWKFDGRFLAARKVDESIQKLSWPNGKLMGDDGRFTDCTES